MGGPEMESTGPVRIDKLLGVVRLYKTRALATEACRGGHVSVNGEGAKASRDVRVGDVVSAKIGIITRPVRVRKAAEKRVGPKLVEDLVEDLTPASEYLKLLQQKEVPVAKRERGAGRPTKRDRRLIERFKGEPDL